MKFIRSLFIFLNLMDDKTQAPSKPRRYVKDVKPGEYIYIEWHKIQGNIGQLKCINNDLKTKKILLEVHWNNLDKDSNQSKIERLILKYNAAELKNFNLLNQIQIIEDEEDIDDDIASLQKLLNEAIENEQYEKAEELQTRINKILNK